MQSIIWSQKSALFEISINDIAEWTCWLVYCSVGISRYLDNEFGQQNSKPEIKIISCPFSSAFADCGKILYTSMIHCNFLPNDNVLSQDRSTDDTRISAISAIIFLLEISIA